MNSFYTSNLLFILHLGCRSSAAHKCLNVKVPCQLELNIPKLIFYPFKLVYFLCQVCQQSH